ncbi:CYTH domain-containing protein [Halobacillus rhizosphaerae]|uniref:CYTH domain-containing protein n=1 Tax=Halobacillus rhizosphaerae TaxID=3064889 RepID=UPI00398AB377
MSQEIEIEFKNLLTEEEFTRLSNRLSFDTVELIEQTNYYFETKNLQLRAQGSALRIRKKDNQWTLTLKQPHSEGLLETHASLTAEEANLWIQNKPVDKPDIVQQLKGLGVKSKDLIYLGSLTTRRKEMEYQGTTVVLDHSLYYGREDYELEIEAASVQQGQQVIKQLLEELNIPKRETDNKIKRFYQAKLQSE